MKLKRIIALLLVLLAAAGSLLTSCAPAKKRSEREANEPKQTVEVRELIRDLSAEHTVVFSSHILSEVQQLCPRVIILNEGRVALDCPDIKGQKGTLEEIFLKVISG